MTAIRHSLPRRGDGRYGPGVDLLGVLHAAVSAALGAVETSGDFDLVDPDRGQHAADLAADAAAVGVLLDAGLGVLSEESGRHEAGREVTVVLDPLDGSTNASQGIPWYAASVCAVDGDGPLAAVVANAGNGERYEAARDGGARRDGQPIQPSSVTELEEAVVGLSGLPPTHLGWRQFRALGAIALDLCAVADGRLDAFVDCSPSAHGPWDYLGGVLVCREAGAVADDAGGRDLVVIDHSARRTPVAAGTPKLFAAALAARGTFPV
jgi:fructose-1,6-bisphosphatase/inositol monophosphatase family enzyme